MTDDIRNSLSQLRSLSPKLNKATDEATAVVAAVEKFLHEECSLGISTNVRAWENDELRLYLAYERVGGKFRIAIIEDQPAYEIDEDENRRRTIDDAGDPAWRTVATKAWAEAARVDKLRTFSELPTLLKMLASETASSIEQMEKTCETVQQVIGALEDATIASARKVAGRYPAIDIGPDETKLVPREARGSDSGRKVVVPPAPTVEAVARKEADRVLSLREQLAVEVAKAKMGEADLAAQLRSLHHQ